MKPKFRAWDVHEKKMFTNDQLIVWNGNVYANDNSELNVDNLKGWSIDEKYLMQSTGLLDKNGKEIFEGDIVRVTMLIGKRTTTSIGAVKFDKYEACFRIQNELGSHYVTMFHSRYFEVIGDIYQNPELLGEKNGISQKM